MSQDFADFKAPGSKPILNSIFDVSDSFLGELRLWLEQNPPAIGISNILGFSQFTAQIATDTAAVSSSSTSYGDSTGAAGPELSGLPDGNYVVAYGCAARNTTSGANSLMSIQVNSTAATDDDATYATISDYVSVARLNLKKLDNAGNNTITLKYRVSSNTGNYQNRWLLALKYSNL